MFPWDYSGFLEVKSISLLEWLKKRGTIGQIVEI